MRLLAAMLLTGGTCIGGGMLALPVVTASLGFIPSLIIMACACAFMTITGLLFVEANLWFEEGAHLFTITSRLLGPIGRAITILLYLFIGYASLVAYTDAASYLHVPPYAMVLVFGIIILLGQRVIGPINTLLFVGMIGAYILLITGGISQIQSPLLLRSSWGLGLSSLPLMLTIFSYQAIVPSLVRYLHRDGPRLRLAIIGGAIIAFLVYALWQALILGIVPPEGFPSLNQALKQNVLITEPLRQYTGGHWISSVGEFFAFFALVTSFLGIGMGLFDFLADGLRIPRKWWGRILLGLLVMAPTYFFVRAFPNIFIDALDLTGGFGDAILNGIIPVLLVWSGRYIHQMQGNLRLPGGTPFLFIIIAFALLVLGVECYDRITHLWTIQDLR